ncbi:MAG: hypothetical protein R8M45_03740 [Ghiorsea sp.]
MSEVISYLIEDNICETGIYFLPKEKRWCLFEVDDDYNIEKIGFCYDDEATEDLWNEYMFFSVNEVESVYGLGLDRNLIN